MADGEPTDTSAHVATLWTLEWEANRLSCRVVRADSGFQLRVESETAVIVTEAFDLQPRAIARAYALRDALERRGWHAAPSRGAGPGLPTV